MKKSVSILLMLSAVLISLLTSCISLQSEQITPDERAETQVIGTVTASWISFSLSKRDAVENKAISELKAEAQRRGFAGNIGIRNIRVGGSFHILTIFYGLFQKVTASGDVVEYVTSTGTGSGLVHRKASDAITQKGPPAVKVVVTIVNKCDWQVPVRLERSKYSIWWEDFDDTITNNGWVVLKPGESISYNIDKNVGDWFFFIKNTTNGTYSYNSSSRSFHQNTTIMVRWVEDDYSWNFE
jgi:hypothetical protein